MEFIINKSDIRDVLAKVQGIIGRKTSLSITGSVLIKIVGSGMTISATDLETGFEGFYPARVESGGTVAVNGKKLYEIIRDFPSEEILIHEIDNRWIEIGNERVEYHIMGMNPDDFPDMPVIEDVNFFEMEAVLFKRMIDKSIIIGTGTDEKRAHINGLFFQKDPAAAEEKVAKMISTDGSRLSKIEAPFEGDFEIPEDIEGFLIPKKGMSEVSKFLGSEGKVQLGFKENHFIVKKEGETLVLRLLEGDFPKYAGIITQKEGSSDISIDRQLLISMLKRMSILSSDDYKSVVFSFDSNRLEVTTTNPDLGESKEDMGIDYDGDMVELAFNPRFFIDSLNAVEDKTAVLNILDLKNPCLVRGENDNNFLTAIMPMKI
ncbi:DNA polymerase III subunit beta [Desulfobacterales bacterium HSG16]|nr:DNA polymerase III subunit beta [Desulfobacterales bacterium HSG16]